MFKNIYMGRIFPYWYVGNIGKIYFIYDIKKLNIIIFHINDTTHIINCSNNGRN